MLYITQVLYSIWPIFIDYNSLLSLMSSFSIKWYPAFNLTISYDKEITRTNTIISHVSPAVMKCLCCEEWQPKITIVIVWLLCNYICTTSWILNVLSLQIFIFMTIGTKFTMKGLLKARRCRKLGVKYDFCNYKNRIGYQYFVPVNVLECIFFYLPGHACLVYCNQHNVRIEGKASIFNALYEKLHQYASQY